MHLQEDSPASFTWKQGWKIKKGQKCIWHLWHEHAQIFILGEGGPLGNGIWEVSVLFKTLLGDVIAFPPSSMPIMRLLMAVTQQGSEWS